jgi:outer membrane protein OmpA-like peptidoglycan-associated protein
MKAVYLKKAALLGSALSLSLICLAFTDASMPVKNNALRAKFKTSTYKRHSPKLDLKDVSLKHVRFDFNKDAIRTDFYPELDRVVKLMNDNNGSIQLSGHADNKGPYVYNWNLSKQRAEAVKAYLVKKGASEERIAAVEFGDTKPIASNRTKAGRQKNRRVELTFL